MNKLVFNFKEDTPFNDNLLNEMSDEIGQLDNSEAIHLYFNGKIPVEVGMYMVEISSYCDLNLYLDEVDAEAKEFLEQAIRFANKKMIIKFNKEKK